MEITLDKLIRLITAEVVKELQKQGVHVIDADTDDVSKKTSGALRTKIETLDMSRYVTPVLTEAHIRKLHVLTGEIIIPKGTIITPKARELIKEKQLLIQFSG